MADVLQKVALLYRQVVKSYKNSQKDSNTHTHTHTLTHTYTHTHTIIRFNRMMQPLMVDAPLKKVYNNLRRSVDNRGDKAFE